MPRLRGPFRSARESCSYGPPREAVEAARRFGGATSDHRYGPVEGLPALVDLLEAKLASENGIQVRPASRVLVTAGGNQAFMNAVLAVTDPGDEIILPAPYYFNHEMAIVMAGARAVAVADGRPLSARCAGDRRRNHATDAGCRHGVTEQSDRRGLSGGGAERGQRALQGARHFPHARRGLRVLHLRQRATFLTRLARGRGDHTISLYSLSKAYGMASWRIGYMVIPEALSDAVNKIQDTLLICPPAVSQQAALAALLVGRGHAAAHVERARFAHGG